MADGHAPTPEEFVACLGEAVIAGYLKYHPDDLDKPHRERRILKGPRQYNGETDDSEFFAGV